MRTIAYNNFQLFFIKETYNNFKNQKQILIRPFIIQRNTDLQCLTFTLYLAKVSNLFTFYRNKKPLRYFFLLVSLLIFSSYIHTFNTVTTLNTVSLYLSFFFDIDFFYIF